MFNQLKNILLLFFVISLTACSYSPDALKKLYAELPNELAGDIKESVDLTAKQSAMVDDYARQLAQWHRHNKLPEYSQLFAQLAQLTRQSKPSINALQQLLSKIDDMPHFYQARHLSYKMAAVGRSLNRHQISQLAKSQQRKYEEERLSISNHRLAMETKDDLTKLFSFIGVTLNAEQMQILTTEAKRLHDIRYAELEAEKKSNHQLIQLLKHPNNPQFVARFSQLWDMKKPKLSTADAQKRQQNQRTFALLIQKLIISFSVEQRNQLANKLFSISHTFSEMANE